MTVVRPAPTGSAARGIACILASGLILTAQDAVTKWLVADYPVGEIMCLRSLFAFAVMTIPLARRGGIARLGTSIPGLHLLRTLLFVVSGFLYILGLRFLPLADSILVTFTSPLFATALATPLLGEMVGWRRWVAVLVGFAGIAVMAQPGGDVFQLALLLPLGAALLAAFRDIVTRRMTAIDSSTTILFYSTLGLLLAGLATWPLGWRPIPAHHWGLFVVMGTMMVAGHYLMIQAVRHAEVIVVVPFRYANLIWAALIGYLVWGAVPAASAFAGAGLVIGSGLYIFHRELTHLRRRADLRREG